MYHNTTPEQGKTLEQSEAKATNVQTAVLWFFKLNKGLAFTPIEVYRFLCRELRQEFLLTSIRRAISDLTKQDRLVKTDYFIVEQYGKRNNKWTLKL